MGGCSSAGGSLGGCSLAGGSLGGCSSAGGSLGCSSAGGSLGVARQQEDHWGVARHLGFSRGKSLADIHWLSS